MISLVMSYQRKKSCFWDESRFCKTSDNRWVWRCRSQYTPSIFKRKEKFSKISLIAWGAIWVGCKSKLLFFESKVDAGKYKEKLLESVFIQEADSVYGRRDWVFV
jgi:hypothetical protein